MRLRLGSLVRPHLVSPAENTERAFGSVPGLHGTHTVGALTRHLEAVVQDGHEVRVGFAVGQPPPGQLEHLRGAFCVYVNLVYRENRAESSIQLLNCPGKGRTLPSR